MTDAIPYRYDRQVLLKDWGESGQRALMATKFVIIGAGGLGSPAALCLTESGAGEITIIDSDVVEENNLPRQLLHTPDRLGMNKAQSAKITLGKINPLVRVIAEERRADDAVLEEVLVHADILLDCSDNFKTRHVANRVARKLGKILVAASAVRFSGQVAVFDFRDKKSPCYSCLFPEDNGQDTKASAVGVFSAVTGIIGMMAADQAMKAAAGLPCLTGKLLMIDTLTQRYETLGLMSDPECPVCRGQH